jgi:hydrogenase maturation protease
MGNDLLRDDAVALHAARALRERFRAVVDIEETGEAGFALLEHLGGRERALLLDAVCTGAHPPGTIVTYDEADFIPLDSPSPHYAGVPDLRVLAARSGIPYPAELHILAMEVEDPHTIAEELSQAVCEALPAYVEAAAEIVEKWTGEEEVKR